AYLQSSVCVLHDPAPTALTTRALHDALPIFEAAAPDTQALPRALRQTGVTCYFGTAVSRGIGHGAVVVTGGLALPRGLAGESARSEEHTSELQSRVDLVCRLLLEKKKNQ